VLVALFFCGSFLLPPVFGALANRSKSIIWYLPVFFLISLSITGICLTSSSLPLMAFIFVIGGGSSTLEGGFSAVLAHENPGCETDVMYFSQMCFCIGAAAGAAISYVTRLAGWGWRGGYFTTAAILAVAGVTVFYIRRNKLSFDRLVNVTVSIVSGIIENKKKPLFVLMSAVMLIYVGIEAGTAFWAGGFSVELGGIDESFLLAAYWIAMAIGRGAAKMIKKAHITITIAGMALASVCLTMMLTGPGSVISVLLYLGVGAGFAPLWPFVMARVNIEFSENAHFASGIMMAAGAAGAAGVPLLMGFLIDHSSAKVSYILLTGLAVFLTLMVLFGFSGRKRRVK